MLQQPYRRNFLKKLSGLVGAASAVGVFYKWPLMQVLSAQAAEKGKKGKAESAKVAAPEPLPAGATAVGLDDAVGSALGYHIDVKTIDAKKYPQYRAGQFCHTCALYAKENNSWGKCTMIAGGLVAAQGWCGSWQLKAGAAKS